MRLKPGATYELRAHSEDESLGVLIYACVEECTAKTVRFKKDVPGYKVLILFATGSWTRGTYEFAPGQIHLWPDGAHLTRGVKRIG